MKSLLETDRKERSASTLREAWPISQDQTVRQRWTGSQRGSAHTTSDELLALNHFNPTACASPTTLTKSSAGHNHVS